MCAHTCKCVHTHANRHSHVQTGTHMCKCAPTCYRNRDETFTYMQTRTGTHIHTHAPIHESYVTFCSVKNHACDMEITSLGNMLTLGQHHMTMLTWLRKSTFPIRFHGVTDECVAMRQKHGCTCLQEGTRKWRSRVMKVTRHGTAGAVNRLIETSFTGRLSVEVLSWSESVCVSYQILAPLLACPVTPAHQ